MPAGRCPHHDLALASDGTCLRCGPAEAEVRAGVRGTRIAAGLLLAFVVAGVLAWALRPKAPGGAATPQASAPYIPPSAPPLEALASAAVAPDPTIAPTGSGAPTPLTRAMHLATITFYSQPASPNCALARTWLLDRGYAFKERDVDRDPQARDAWSHSTAANVVPAFDIDGQIVGGFDPARIQGALEYAGARRLQR